MPKIIVSEQDAKRLAKVVPEYLRRSRSLTQQVRWAIARLASMKSIKRRA